MKKTIIFTIFLLLLTSCNQNNFGETKKQEVKKENIETVDNKTIDNTKKVEEKKSIQVEKTEKNKEIKQSKNTENKKIINKEKIKEFLENFYFPNEKNRECSFIDLIKYYNKIESKFPMYLKVHCSSYSYDKKNLTINKSIDETILLLKLDPGFKILKDTKNEYKEYYDILNKSYTKEEIKSTNGSYNLTQKLIDDNQKIINFKWEKFKNPNNLQTKEKTETMAKTENIQKTPLQEGDYVATMKTTNGTIKIKLFNNIVPNTVNNFVGLAKEGYYNGIIFHRVINGFMIQGGDPSGTGMGGESIYGEKFNDEFSDDLKNIKYSISMANSGENTNGSQFFINQADNNFLDNKHSVFGQVIEGMENVDKIAKAKTNGQDKPQKEIKIIDLKVEKYNGKTLEKLDFDKDEAIKNYKESIKSAMDAKKAALKAKREANKNKVLKNGDTVSVHYTLTVDGKKKDSSLDRGQPFTFTLGKKMVIKGWDEGLVGHKIGDKFKLEVAPKDGYGEAEIKIPKTELQSFIDAGIKLEKGEILQTAQGNLDIIDADDTTISIANNHELAEKTLNFDIEIVDIK